MLTVVGVPEAWPSPSPKRGVCAKGLSAEDFKALAPGVSWWYNWSPTPDTALPAGGPEFVPMLWGDSPGLWEGLNGSLRENPHPRVILAINEPNLKSQANLSPEAAAKAWLRVKTIVDQRGIPLVGPQLALGSDAKESIQAHDPIQKKDVTYGWMGAYLDAFNFFLPHGVSLTVGVHPYGNVGELKWAVAEMAKRTGHPVWVTEFNEWKAASEEAEIEYMKEAVAFLEASPDVAGYAWFMARTLGQPTHSLLAPESGRLTRLGEAYVSFPGGR